jgi:imidazoleglycerol-phosphate dehydratase
MTSLRRQTRETSIRLNLMRDGEEIVVKTDDRFLSHMVETLARYAGVGLVLDATGDLRHHLVEDVGIAMGLALRRETPAAAARYGWSLVPMDEALVQVAVDLGGRSWYEGSLPSRLYEHFMQSLAVNLGAAVHLRVIRGTDRHHVVEAATKALGLALRQAMEVGSTVFSTKGAVEIEWGDDPGLTQSSTRPRS